MHQHFPGVDEGNFMQNFNSSFTPDDAILEMVRRISEREAEEKRKKNRASVSAVEKLPIIEIEKKHCKPPKAAQGNVRAYISEKNRLEPPTCTICVEFIPQGKKGMFMPCGHIYHPACLKPWLEVNNTCPVCRYEIPKQSDVEDKK